MEQETWLLLYYTSTQSHPIPASYSSTSHILAAFNAANNNKNRIVMSISTFIYLNSNSNTNHFAATSHFRIYSSLLCKYFYYFLLQRPCFPLEIIQFLPDLFKPGVRTQSRNRLDLSIYWVAFEMSPHGTRKALHLQ